MKFEGPPESVDRSPARAIPSSWDTTFTEPPSSMDLPSPRPSVILKEMSDGAVLYDTSTEVYFGLNEVGLVIWQSLGGAAPQLEDVVRTLSERFPEIPKTTIREDALEFLSALQDNGLVAPPESAVSTS
jgi:hypothetical protein